MTSLQTIRAQYESDVDALPAIHANGGGGAARNASGLVYENLIKRTCDLLGFDARKNDYKSTEEIDGVSMSNLQVDWHVYKGGTLRLFVASKTYLDSCYLMRAVIDLIELDSSPDTPDDCQFAIFAGQDACKAESAIYFSAFFKKHTGKDLTIFFANPQQRRRSSRPIFKADCRQDFTLSTEVHDQFINWLETAA